MNDVGTLGKIQRIDINSSEFPSRLKNIPDPPEQLYCAGDISLLQEDSVAVVGSRKYTVYGKTVAMMIGRRLAECGIPVVSGLALGIDAFSHQGALDAGGKVIGVLAGGLQRMTPKSNLGLMKRGLEMGGLVVSEYPPDVQPRPFSYPLRNRIISGLGKILVVVEANFNSGALITAQHASNQGRTVYAVPGNINSQFSAGSNFLIRDGASPLVVIDDLVRDLGKDPGDTGKRLPQLGEDERMLLNEIRLYNGVTPDTLSGRTGKSVSLINSLVTVMEIKGIVETYGGKIYLAN